MPFEVAAAETGSRQTYTGTKLGTVDAFYKCVAMVQGTNIVRRELKLPEVPIRAADPDLAFLHPDRITRQPRI